MVTATVNDFYFFNGFIGRYRISDQDIAGSGVFYFGYVDPAGAWYLMKQDGSSNPTTYRYVKGDSDYTTAWTNRATQTYDYFYTVFK